MRKFEIRYNDGVYAESVMFDENHNDKFISEFLLKRIEKYNKNPNKDYHITMDNINEIKE